MPSRNERLLLDILAKDRLVLSVWIWIWNAARECAPSVTIAGVSAAGSPYQTLLLTEACDLPGCRCTKLLYSTPSSRGWSYATLAEKPLFHYTHVRRGYPIVALCKLLPERVNRRKEALLPSANWPFKFYVPSGGVMIGLSDADVVTAF